MLSYPVILKALKITCYVKHWKCPATPPSPNTLQIITFIIPHLSSHQYISLPLLWLQPWWVWYPFHLLLLAHIFTAAPQTMAHYSHKLGITPAGISRILQAALSCCQPLQTPLPLSSCSVKNLLLSPEVLISSNGICSQKQRQYTGLVHRNSHEPSTLSGEKY